MLQKDLIVKTGIKQNMLSIYENEETDLKKSVILKLSYALDISPEYFFTDKSIDHYDEKKNEEKMETIFGEIPIEKFAVAMDMIEAWSDKFNKVNWELKKQGKAVPTDGQQAARRTYYVRKDRSENH